MNSFVIGKIIGHWDNFVPPIQGGVFRPYNPSEEDELLVGEGATDLEPMPPNERSPTPSSVSSVDSILFDPTLRRRHESSPMASSVTSLSSIPPEASQEYMSSKELEIDLVKYPSLDDETQRNIVYKYRELEVSIKSAGLYKCNYWAYGWECIRYFTFLFSSLVCLNHGWYRLSAVFLGCFWHQLTFAAHDAGHIGITGDFQKDTCIGILVADFCGGLSLGWWKRNHNVCVGYQPLEPWLIPTRFTIL